MVHLRYEDEDPWIIEKKIFDILNHHLQLDSDVSATAAAEQIDSLYPENRSEDNQPPEDQREPPNEPYGFFWAVWRCVYDVAGQIPHSDPAIEKLATFVNTLRHFKSKSPTTYLGGYGGTLKLWEDLPLIGSVFREFFDYDVRSDERGRSLNAFAARLLRDGSAPWEHLACEALDAMGDCEDGVEPGPVLDCQAAIAVDYITHCGRILFANQDQDTRPRGARIWGQGSSEITVVCWRTYIDRLEQISKHPEVCEETRTMVQNVIPLMEELAQEVSSKATNSI